jgi:manganese-transporting P-type ATPase
LFSRLLSFISILIILPTYISLMTLSFFIKVFCVALWCLDEYWYYSLFTLFMLFLFESTMAKNRLKTLTELRRVKVDNQIVLTYRCGKYGSFI